MEKYEYLEVEEIFNMYDNEERYSYIAEEVNRNFHDGRKVRTKNSVSYVLNKINSELGDKWLDKLENEWLKSIK